MSKSRSRREYLILTDNSKVLYHIFHLTKKYNFIGRLYYDLTHFLIIWEWLTFWATLCNTI